MNPRVCDQHGTTPNPLCHVQQARAPRVLPLVQQAVPSDEYGLSWQVIRDVLLAAAVTALVLWIVFSAWLSR